LSLLKAGDIEAAAEMAVNRLRIAGFRALRVAYAGGMDATRLAASLLIPVRTGSEFGAAIFHKEEKDNQ
jgi:hypothetical protein